MKKIIYRDIGLIDYKEAWDFQKKIFSEVLDSKQNILNLGRFAIPHLRDRFSDTCLSARQAERVSPSADEFIQSKYKSPHLNKNHLIFCEHPHVYTLGKSGLESNLLINQIQLQAQDASFYKIDRGGDITYHGPGQLVGYPILDLEMFGIGLKEYVYMIEETIIKTLKEFSITAERLEGATGVWLNTQTTKVRKICAIGVKISRSITMHGFAFNINTDLNYFKFINPCGFTDKSVTSLEKELRCKQDMEKVKTVLKAKFAEVFGVNLF
ncbi:MAG: lipoyl(octanoyl) transferase LipB [Bacteroidales bacterium]